MRNVLNLLGFGKFFSIDSNDEYWQSMRDNMKKEKAALVLSGGSALGAVELGILSVLEKKYEFEFFAGTSIGSLISVFFANGKTATEILGIFNSKTLREIFTDFSTGGFGMIRGQKFLKFLEKELAHKKFSDFETPMTFVATNFSNGNRVNLNENSVAEAVRASCGIPIFFEPHQHSITKEWLVDGGLSQNFPLDVAVEKYAGTKIIAIDVGAFLDESIDFSQKNFWNSLTQTTPLIERTIRIMMKNQHDQIEDNRVEIFAPEATKFSSMKFTQKNLKVMFEYGQTFANDQLKNV